MRTDNPPYKLLPPVFGFNVHGTCRIVGSREAYYQITSGELLLSSPRIGLVCQIARITDVD